jgi:hypothetical protein
MSQYQFHLSGGGISKKFYADTAKDAYTKAMAWYKKLSAKSQQSKGIVTMQYRVEAISGRIHNRIAADRHIIEMHDAHLKEFVRRYENDVMQFEQTEISWLRHATGVTSYMVADRISDGVKWLVSKIRRQR